MGGGERGAGGKVREEGLLILPRWRMAPEKMRRHPLPGLACSAVPHLSARRQSC